MNKFELMHYKLHNGLIAYNKWIVPYIKSLVFNSYLRPVLSYLYTDWKCNIDCHYCFQYNNNGTNMSPETAKSAVDWLNSLGCRVIALMGGEPLIRKDFILNLIRYASKQGFFIYLPTNGYLLDRDYIDRLGDAGITAINLAVDCIHPRPGLPKSLMAIESQFRYLVRQQEKYGYILFFNMNITSKNFLDIKMLTEIAHDNHIATDYHINEPPFETNNVSFFNSRRDGMYITPDLYDKVDELLDWIIMKNRMGYTMVNSAQHLIGMKDFMRGKKIDWKCRAGHNGMMIKPDGSISPCFGLMTYNHDWGRIGQPKFDDDELKKVKETCHEHCFSTCFYTMGHYYHPVEALKWLLKHTSIGN